MTVILEDYRIVGAGTFEIRQPVHLTISAEAARRAANDLARAGWLSLHTRTMARREYARRVAAGLKTRIR